jgi:hypothetical protein
MSYAWEKLHCAIHCLAGAGTQQDRLVGAGMNFVALEPKDFPAELQDDFIDIKQRMTCVPAQGDEGTLVATAKSLDEIELSSIVKDIISLHDAITRRQEPFT